MPFELVPDGTHIDFIGKRRICAAISAAMFLAGGVGYAVNGVRFGIDFAGGTEVQVRFENAADVEEGAIRDVASLCGIADPSVVRYGDLGGEFLLRFNRVDGDPAACPITDVDRQELDAAEAASDVEGSGDETGEIVEILSRALRNHVGPLEIERVEFVGPRVGADLRRDGISALFWASFFILLYVGFRFSLRYAPGAVVALVHDVLITAGIFVIFQLEFDLRVLAALLAIMGYSLNDTIIIYDRIRENMRLRTKHDLVEVLNLSVNQTLSRTILTSGTTMMAVGALYFVGGEEIRPFALAMAIGIVVGTYSSIFIAAPALLLLEQRFGSGDESGRRGSSGNPRKKTKAA